MDGDAASEGDIADDLVAGHRPAALRQADRDLVHALDLDPEAPCLAGAPHVVGAPL